jgi:hypothetical protein
MAARPWILKAGRVVPHSYPNQMIVPAADVRLCRGLVSPGRTVRVPAGNAGTTVVVCVDRRPDVKALGGISMVATGAWLLENNTTVPYDLPTSFFAGLYPQYSLEEQEGRQQLLDRIRAFAKLAGSTRARIVPSFLETPSGIMSCIRKLPDWDKFMVHSLGPTWRAHIPTLFAGLSQCPEQGGGMAYH